ncbi:MAG: SdrD B-like domain-containing protein [Saprospiraceae bacterium]
MGQQHTALHFFKIKLMAAAVFAVLPALLSAQISVMFLQTNVSCNGRCDGLAIAVGLNGAFPYTYVWSTGDTGTTIDSLCAGVYTVTVTDANSATATGSVSIIQPNLLSVAVSTQDQICGIAPDGEATAVPTGGTAPYSFLWSNTGTGIEITGLTGGPYTVTVTDFNGCTAVAGNTVFFQNEGIWLMATPTHIPCFGDSNGSVYAAPMTGTQPYTYNWGSGYPQTQTLPNLPPGTYTVTVTDINGCSNTASATVTEPPVLDILTNFTAAACGQPGNATVTPSGGTPGYTILWNNSDTTFTTTGPAGPVTAVVTDANGCTLNLNLNIPGNNTVISANTDKLGDVLCLRGGSASASATGSTGTFAYLWSNGDTTAVADSLAVGTYTVTITEHPSGCTATATTAIQQAPSTLIVTANATGPATCLAGGSAAALASGGTPPFVYVWNGTITGATVANLAVGPNIVVVTDATGCTATDTVAITKSPLPSVTASIFSPVTCSVLGAAKAVATGGLAPYTYAWSSGSLTDTAPNLLANTYTVTATDSGGCTATATVVLTAPPIPTVTVGSAVNATCIKPGSATATAAGGTPPFTYFWDSGATTATAANLASGTHTVTATDSGGCTATSTVQISAPPIPSVTIAVTAQTTCTSLGALLANATGGTPTLTFLWSNAQPGPALSGLPPNTYTVTVTDGASCTATASATLTPPPAINVTIGNVTNASCSGPGSATAVATSGTPPFSYLWSNGITTATANNLTQGMHTVTVTDANNCTATAMVTIQVSGSGGTNLGDFVWYDNDQDGAQHALEKGVPGIRVQLVQPGLDTLFGTPDDVVLSTILTDSTGKYKFSCVVPGKYVVKFSGLQTGYEFTGKNKVNNTCKDSDAKANGNTDPITIVAGQADTLCIDAGIHTICENVTKPGLICCNQTICEGETPDALYGNPLYPPQGGSGPLEYVWMQYVQNSQGQWTWVPIPGSNGSTYQPGPLVQTAYFMRCVRRQNCLNFLESNMITITVKPAGSSGCPQFFTVFVVTPMSNAAVKLEWRTLPAMDRYLYVAERSMNQTDWTVVGEILGEQYAPERRYTLMDHMPESGMNYYRVRRLSATGEPIQSEVREAMLEVPLSESLAVYPNPAAQVLYVRNLTTYESDAQVQLFTVNGVLLHALKIAAGSLAFFEIPVADLPAGIYLARIVFGSGETKSVKVSKF